MVCSHGTAAHAQPALFQAACATPSAGPCPHARHACVPCRPHPLSCQVHAALEAGLVEAAAAEAAKPEQLPAGLQQRVQDVAHLRQRHGGGANGGANGSGAPPPQAGMFRG